MYLSKWMNEAFLYLNRLEVMGRVLETVPFANASLWSSGLKELNSMWLLLTWPGKRTCFIQKIEISRHQYNVCITCTLSRSLTLLIFNNHRKPEELKDLAPGTNPPFLVYNKELKTDFIKIEEFLEQTLAPPRYSIIHDVIVLEKIYFIALLYCRLKILTSRHLFFTVQPLLLFF